MNMRHPAWLKSRSTHPRLSQRQRSPISRPAVHAMPAVNVQHIAFTVYPVTDMARARAFYEGLLGLKTEAVYEKDGRYFIEYAVGSGTFALSNMMPAHGGVNPPGAVPCAALEVLDFGAAVEVMKEANAEFTFGPLDTGDCMMAVVSDPDGNALMLHHKHNP